MNFRFVLLLSIFAAGLAAAPVRAGETINKIGIAMVDIPAGTFLMGACKTAEDKRNDLDKQVYLGKAPVAVCNKVDSGIPVYATPQHRVTLKAFQLGKTEVTLGQFKQYIAASGRNDLMDDDFKKYNAYGDNAPVVYVNWQDAQAFISWLNKIDGGGYRLPSESEWEYACHAGERNTYCGGNTVESVAWYYNNSKRQQHAVAGKKPNAWGLYDMSGNAWEWVQDCWHDSYRDAPGDGSAWSCFNGRGLRGGSWDVSANYTRSVERYSSAPEYRYMSFGFRVARAQHR